MQALGGPPGREQLDFYSLKSHLLDFVVIQTGYWPDFNKESIFFSLKIYLFLKNLTDFRKTRETQGRIQDSFKEGVHSSFALLQHQ